MVKRLCDLPQRCSSHLIASLQNGTTLFEIGRLESCRLRSRIFLPNTKFPTVHICSNMQEKAIHKYEISPLPFVSCWGRYYLCNRTCCLSYHNIDRRHATPFRKFACVVIACMNDARHELTNPSSCTYNRKRPENSLTFNYSYSPRSNLHPVRHSGLDHEIFRFYIIKYLLYFML